MLCARCGAAIHPCYENGAVCEDCFADNAQKFNLPGSLSYGRLATQQETDDDDADQIDILPSEADRQGCRRMRRGRRGELSHALRQRDRRREFDCGASS